MIRYKEFTFICQVFWFCSATVKSRLSKCLAEYTQFSDDQSVHCLGENGQRSFKANELLSLTA